MKSAVLNLTERERPAVSLKVREFERLLDEINGCAADALESGKAADLRRALEEVADLTDPDSVLDFSGDEIMVLNDDEGYEEE
ncbi:MAG TPA: hypothetical protein VGC87_23205 [Pyrinomonadaceae bacterium]